MSDHSASVMKAARWLAITPRDKLPDRPLIPYLRDTYGLSPKEACDACREAQLIKARAH